MFTHLHTHSHYSLLNALPKIPDLIKATKEAGMTSLALTDNGNMYGAIEFYKDCKKADIKPIIGVDFYMALNTRFDKRPGIDNRRNRLVLLAKDEIGYKNLMQLASLSHLEGFYYRPRIDKELIEKYHQGLICICPQFSGDVSKAIQMSDFEKADSLTDWYKNLFKDDLYFEITHHPEIERQEKVKADIVKYAREKQVKLVATHDIYYLKPEDKKARDVLMSIQGTGLGGRPSDGAEDFSFVSSEKMDEYFKNEPEAIKHTEEIVDKCNLEIDLDSWFFPEIEIPKGEDYNSWLEKLTYEGIEKRNIKRTKEIEDRIKYELDIIKNKGYSSYFLIVSDLISYAREAGIYTNTRGSAAGSLVSYLNFITKVNPIELELPFERFMNPYRPGIPDIDLDIADIKRDEIIQYAKDKYGKENVAQIGTFGTMAARGSVKDTARAMGYEYAIGDKISKLIPMGSQGFAMTIKRALEEEPDLKKLYDSDKDVKIIIDMAQRIEGSARHISTHAAGVLIAPTPIVNYTPVQFDKDNQIITQYDMYTGNRDGVVTLPKFDILGIKNLSILSNAVSLVNKTRGLKIDLDNVDLENKKTYEMLAKGYTVGCFQLSGTGMTKVITEMRPTNINDINAIVALYRPGPMEFIKDYIERKYNPHKRTFIHPKLETILSKSFGVITYQDDILMIAIELAGYTWLEVDKFRKAIGKKIPEMMQEQKDKFYAGCRKNGISKKVVDELWEKIETFAAYGFNKAHAASYGRVAYETSYMKANFPVEYMTSVLTADSGDVDKIHEIVTECKRMEIPVLPPDINESFADFTVVKNDGSDPKPEVGQSPKSKIEHGKIRFGLCTIKNFGTGISDVIIKERKDNGKFKSLADFLTRIKDRNLNKKSLEALTKCGAMDNLGERGQILESLGDLLTYNRECASQPDNQDSLFGLMADTSTLPKLKLKEVSPALKNDKLLWEKELLGLYISGHPLDKFKEILKKDGKNIESIRKSMRDGTTTVIVGIIEEVKPIITKKGAKMAFMKIADFTGAIETVIFPKIYDEYKDILENDKPIMIKGKISNRNNELSMIVDKIKELN